MRPRDPSRLAATRYDLVVVGGGIHGLSCAYEAASRGLTVALLEAGDYGGGTSFNHQKTVHGGLRSLQSLSLRRAREAIVERRAMARMAPWLLRPLPFLVPTNRSLKRGRTALRAAFAIDRWLTRDRNDGLEPELHLPLPRLLSRTATTKLFPGVNPNGLTGAAQWYDYQMVENDRLTFAFAAAADRAGADLVNHATVQGTVRRDGRIVGVRVREGLTGTDFEVEAAVVVNAAGARAGEVMGMLGVTRPFPLVKAMNLVTRRAAADIALAAPGPAGRMLTMTPWRGRAMVGTWQASDAATLADAGPRQDDVVRFAAEAAAAFPALGLSAEEVTLVHWGLVPAIVRGGTVDLLPASQILDHAAEGVGTAITIVGAKYTTARLMAERTADLVGRKLGKRLAPSRTAARTLPGAAMADHEALAIERARALSIDLAPATISHLTSRYAEAAATIIEVIAERPESAKPLAPHTPTIGAEVLHAIAQEHAARLGDIVLRRTTLGAAGHPGAAALRACAELAAQELGWTAQRMADEIERVEAVYRAR
jgi:glycerol-3-phosphate dehydrogenase